MSYRQFFVSLILLTGHAAVAGPALRFEENIGQVDPQVRFLCRTPGYTLYLTGREAVFDFGLSSMRLAFVDADPAVEMRGTDMLPGTTNYLIGRDPGNWRSGVKSHGRVVYDDLYDGIDLVFREHAGKVEFDFVLEPGADPSRIALDVNGAGTLWLDPDGTLRLAGTDGELAMQAPVVYQGQLPVDGRFVVENERRIRFAIGEYDRNRPLVIDPILSFSTYLGGPEDADEIRDLAVDADGNSYVTGFTFSSDFPLANAMDGSKDSQVDGFVSKLSADGSTLIWSTYFGGDRDDNRNSAAIAVNAAGEVFLAGETNGGTFPTTAGAYESVPQGLSDCYVTRLSADGSTLLYSTILGGTSHDRCHDIAVNDTGNAYVAGIANSTGFPTLAGAFQETNGGGSDAFVTKLTVDGSDLIYSTFVGGSSNDRATGIALIDNDAVITGETSSSLNFPLAGAFQGNHAGINDAFVTRLNAAGSGLAYSSFHGGSRNDFGLAIASDNFGNVYVTGYTTTFGDMPTTAGAFQETFGGGGEDAFLIKIDPSGGLAYSTYLGGTGNDKASALAVVGNWPRVAGTTTSFDFPTVGPIQAEQAVPTAPRDAFVATFAEDGSALLFSTYLGGNGAENGRDQSGIGIGPGGAIHIAGQTGAEDFPTTPGSFQDADPDAPSTGTFDGFVAKIHECDVTGLRFLASKTDFEWSPTGLDQCGVLFDTTRGELGALMSSGGDFSTALCLENDDVDTTASDVDTPPSGDGFWYLARVDGSTWNGAGTAGDRDATLVDCP